MTADPAPPDRSEADRLATQAFAVRNVLVAYTGRYLTPDLVTEIFDRLTEEMRSGATAWAFRSDAGGNAR